MAGALSTLESWVLLSNNGLVNVLISACLYDAFQAFFFFFLKAANELFSMIYSSPLEQFKNIITFVFNTALLFKILLHHITNVNRKKP